jgi:hypothetical protein
MAQVKNFFTYQILANVLQEQSGQDGRKSHYMKFEAMDDGLIKVCHQCIVSAGHQSVRIEMQRKWLEDAVSDIKRKIPLIEEGYKKAIETRESLLSLSPQPYKESPAKTVKISLLENSIQEVSEPLSYQVYNPNKTSVYKVFALLKVS